MKRYAGAVAAALTAVLAGSLAVRAKPEGRAESLRAVRTLTLASGPERNVSVYSGEIRARMARAGQEEEAEGLAIAVELAGQVYRARNPVIELDVQPVFWKRGDLYDTGHHLLTPMD